jgi:hypothetical protein
VPEPVFEQAHYCWRCGQPVVVTGAQFCKECGAPLAGGHFFALNPGFNPVLAAVFSIIPGGGHIYKRRPASAVRWFLGVMFAYIFLSIPVGFVLHLICASNAALKGALEDDAFMRLRGNRRRLRRRRSGPFGEQL